MNDAPQIDDRRRFKALWKELVFARILAAGVAGLVLGCLPGNLGPWWLVAAAVLMAAPSAIAKRGHIVLPAVAAAIGAATIAYVMVPEPVDETGMSDGYINIEQEYATVLLIWAAAIGVVEGNLERSLATILSGTLGGMATGLVFLPATILWTRRFTGGSGPWPQWAASFAFYFALASVFTHLSIGLSLALGRWIRDLPKREPPSPV